MRRKRTPLFALVLLLIATVAVRADKIDDYVKAEMQRQHIPGTFDRCPKGREDHQSRGLRPGKC